ncbi:hypothetical protein L0Z13_11320 [Burkholderia multivorans]|uniref:hypothetical protein n=1 Tax=Burkholderia multivorans TaxID=87883 RepID=UPI002019BAA8|nr:hypothetical protein [Burkholderia multivorans]UQO04940.1 hypothetical protein L0Z13_11320 [Burkholderia multivorans]
MSRIGFASSFTSLSHANVSCMPRMLALVLRAIERDEHHFGLDARPVLEFERQVVRRRFKATAHPPAQVAEHVEPVLRGRRAAGPGRLFRTAAPRERRTPSASGSCSHMMRNAFQQLAFVLPLPSGP